MNEVRKGGVYDDERKHFIGERLLITVIHNVTTDMEHISCYADNGYGIPMQAAKKVNISCTFGCPFPR